MVAEGSDPGPADPTSALQHHNSPGLAHARSGLCCRPRVGFSPSRTQKTPDVFRFSLRGRRFFPGRPARRPLLCCPHPPRAFFPRNRALYARAARIAAVPPIAISIGGGLGNLRGDALTSVSAPAASHAARSALTSCSSAAIRSSGVFSSMRPLCAPRRAGGRRFPTTNRPHTEVRGRFEVCRGCALRRAAARRPRGRRRGRAGACRRRPRAGRRTRRAGRPARASWRAGERPPRW